MKRRIEHSAYVWENYIEEMNVWREYVSFVE